MMIFVPLAATHKGGHNTSHLSMRQGMGRNGRAALQPHNAASEANEDLGTVFATPVDSNGSAGRPDMEADIGASWASTDVDLACWAWYPISLLSMP